MEALATPTCFTYLKLHLNQSDEYIILLIVFSVVELYSNIQLKKNSFLYWDEKFEAARNKWKREIEQKVQFPDLVSLNKQSPLAL